MTDEDLLKKPSKLHDLYKHYSTEVDCLKQ